MNSLGITNDVQDLYWHELRLFNIIDSEWKQLEIAEMKRNQGRNR